MQTKIILALIEADKELKKVHAGLDLGTAIEAVVEYFEKENSKIIISSGTISSGTKNSARTTSPSFNSIASIR